MKINQEINPSDIYSIRLTVRKERNGSKAVSITIRPKKKGKPLKRTFPFTGYIYDDDPNYWDSYEGKQISTYYRRDKNLYVSKEKNETISTDIGQRLENLVQRVFNSKNLNK